MNKPLHVAPHGLGYTVFRGGTRVAGIYVHQSDAEARMDKMNRAAKGKWRSCMTCGSGFLSAGPHNRMCDSCRSKAHDNSMSVAVGRATRRAGL